MQIVSLVCRSCGAPLQIKDNVDRLACAHCGVQMFVDRSGGAVTLQLVEALGSIRTGAVQTAAELALVRLQKERQACLERVASLAAQGYELRNNPEDMLDPERLAAAKANAGALRAEVARYENRFPAAGGVFLLAIVVGVVWVWSSRDGFSDVLGGLFWLAVIVVAGFVLVMIVLLRASPDSRSAEADGRIARHDEAVRCSKGVEELREERAELSRIDADIERNRNIVSPLP